MSKKSKKPKLELPDPAEFAARHGIGIETAREILCSFDADHQSGGNESDKGH